MPTKSNKSSQKTTSTTTSKASTVKNVVARTGPRQSVVAPLNRMQLAELIKTFWGDLLQNNVKSIKNFLRENRHRIDFSAARYAACAEGTALHLCAQHGFIDCAKLLIDVGVGIDLQNKVGSTALHVACKFNQESMMLLLLEAGARVTIPDVRNNVAFDVASYPLLDKCLFAPLRVKLAAERKVEDKQLEIHQVSVRQFNSAKLAEAHSSMLVIDWESRAWEERQMLVATMQLDSEWSERIQKTKELLQSKQVMYQEQQQLLQKEQEQTTLTWNNFIRDEKDRRQRAGEEFEVMQMLAQEQEQNLMREQQDLCDQCGLLEAAHEFPNDVEVQQWILSVVIAMLEGSEIEVSPFNAVRATGIDGLLIRQEIISVIRNVLQRFPTTRDLQVSALQCMVLLVRHCIRTLYPVHQSTTDNTNSRSSRFIAALIEANTMTLTRQALCQFQQDLELAHLGVELLYHLLRFRGDGGAHSLQFCQNRLNHHLPIRLFHLHEMLLASQGDADICLRVCSIPLAPIMISMARHHASYILFTMTKYNVQQALDNDDILSVAKHLVFKLATSAVGEGGTIDELVVSTLRYLLGSFALIHSPSTSSNGRKTSPRHEAAYSWCAEDVNQLLVCLRWILKVCGDNVPYSSIYRSLVYWMMRLLWNLSSADGDIGVQIRLCLRTHEAFDFFSKTVLNIRTSNPEKCNDGVDTRSIALLWLEMVQLIWMTSYNSDGQLAATSSFVLKFFVNTLEVEAKLTRLQEHATTFAEIATVLKLIALVLSNGKNMRFMFDRKHQIDTAVHAFLQTILERKMHDEAQGNDNDDDANILEAIANILQIYLRFLDYGRGHDDKQTPNFHDCCRSVGICAVLDSLSLSESVGGDRAKVLENERGMSPKCDKITSRCAGKFKTKLQRAQAWSRTEQLSDHQHERKALQSLARALLQQVPCNCYRVKY